MAIINWFDVGKVAAERDDNLIHYFYDNGISKSVISSSTQFLLLGRKGAGKTAVFLHLSRKPPEIFLSDDIVLSLSLNNYSWNAHALLRNGEKADSISYFQSWRFVMLLEATKAVTLHFEGKEIPAGLRQAKKVLERLFKSPIPSWTDLLGSKLFGLSSLKLPSMGLDSSSEISADFGEVSFEQIKEDNSLKAQLTNNIQYLTEYLEKCLLDVTEEYRVFILFDRLDEAWDSSSVDICKNIISGLIHASDYFVQKLKGKLRPVVFLREDIYETLNLNDKNKLKEDNGKLLKWDKESLLRMLMYRINFYARQSNIAEIGSIDELFDRKEMRQRATPFTYILRSTFMRPRDLICYFKKIIESMNDEKNLLEIEDIDGEDYIKLISTEQLIVDYIYKAESGFSTWLKDEITDEWGVQKPEITNYFNALMNIGTAFISQEKLKASIIGYIKEIDDVGIRKILVFFFESSIIGFKIGESTIWRFKCTLPSQGYIDSDQYRVHFGLVKALNLSETI